MPAKDSSGALPSVEAAAFCTTRWSLVLSAREQDSPEADAALSQLYRTYWYPLYAFARRRGCLPHDAEDLIQGFFVHLLERRDLASVARERGRFRSFLIVALKHFLINQWERRAAEKRGGRFSFVPLESAAAEQRFASEPAARHEDDRAFDRGWAVTLVQTVFTRLREEHDATGRTRTFAALLPFLSTEAPRRSQAEIAAELGLNENAVKQAVHRLRQRYRELLREEIAQTVLHPGDIEDELRHLIEVLRGP
jgi:RNA polymerase sigma factor (sigma-70 family)